MGIGETYVDTRVSRKSSGLSLYQEQEKEAALLVKKQKTYKLLDDDDGSDELMMFASKRMKKKTEVNDDDGDDEEEGILSKELEKRVRRRTSRDDDEDGSESEEERLRDQREKEELEKHLSERDEAGTRKFTDHKLTQKEKEEAIRRSNALKKGDVPASRKASKQEYYKKRVEKKVEELRGEIEDEQYLFEGVKLTEVEKRDLRYKKKIYELLTERSEEADNVNEYRMPDAYDQDGGVNQEKSDTNAEKKMNPHAEQEAWVEYQIRKATVKYGSKNKKQVSDEYQFVFEDQIDFIKESIMDGDNVDL
ncbi:hypothetical protein Lal_00029713 [Lupinus albus]|nr:hypothetical protein Lal_00029713 [Lupinus albus]